MILIGSATGAIMGWKKHYPASGKWRCSHCKNDFSYFSLELMMSNYRTNNSITSAETADGDYNSEPHSFAKNELGLTCRDCGKPIDLDKIVRGVDFPLKLASQFVWSKWKGWVCPPLHVVRPTHGLCEVLVAFVNQAVISSWRHSYMQSENVCMHART